MSAVLKQDEALHIATMLRDDITSGRKTFGAIAEKESHCSSARRQGDLGSFGPGKMQEAFDSATRALKVHALLQINIQCTLLLPYKPALRPGADGRVGSPAGAVLGSASMQASNPLPARTCSAHDNHDITAAE